MCLITSETNVFNFKCLLCVPAITVILNGDEHANFVNCPLLLFSVSLAVRRSVTWVPMFTRLAQDLFMHYLQMKRKRKKRPDEASQRTPATATVTNCVDEDAEETELETTEVESDQESTPEQNFDRIVVKLERQLTTTRATNYNRAIDELNKGKLSEAPLHLEFPKLNWTKKHSERAQELGFAVKIGKFNAQEIQILTANWHQFCDDFVVDNPHYFFGFFNQTDEVEKTERKHAKEVIAKSELYLRLAKGLPDRPIVSVYHKARHLFSGLKKASDLTEEDRDLIMRLHRAGRKNDLIALKTFTDNKTVREVITHNVSADGRKLKKNKWNEDDNQRLIASIEQVMEQDQIIDHSEIKWSEVSILMGDRSALQCRSHFYSLIFLRTYDPESVVGARDWNIKDTQKLVYYLHKNQFNDESEIDWDFLKVKYPQ